MTHQDIRDMFERSPIVAAVKSDELLEDALKSDCQVVFVLYGSILDISGIVGRLKKAGKTAIVHADLIAGFGGKSTVSVDFIHTATAADGIISTKQPLVRRAKELGMIAGERTFMVDSMAYANMRTKLEEFEPDFLEILPGVITTIIGEFTRATEVPIVAGGLIRSRQDILAALDAGARAISTTKKELWSL